MDDNSILKDDGKKFSFFISLYSFTPSQQFYLFDLFSWNEFQEWWLSFKNKRSFGIFYVFFPHFVFYSLRASPEILIACKYCIFIEIIETKIIKPVVQIPHVTPRTPHIDFNFNALKIRFREMCSHAKISSTTGIFSPFLSSYLIEYWFCIDCR